MKKKRQDDFADDAALNDDDDMESQAESAEVDAWQEGREVDVPEDRRRSRPANG